MSVSGSDGAVGLRLIPTTFFVPCGLGQSISDMEKLLVSEQICL